MAQSVGKSVQVLLSESSVSTDLRDCVYSLRGTHVLFDPSLDGDLHGPRGRLGSGTGSTQTQERTDDHEIRSGTGRRSTGRAEPDGIGSGTTTFRLITDTPFYPNNVISNKHP